MLLMLLLLLLPLLLLAVLFPPPILLQLAPQPPTFIARAELRIRDHDEGIERAACIGARVAGDGAVLAERRVGLGAVGA